MMNIERFWPARLAQAGRVQTQFLGSVLEGAASARRASLGVGRAEHANRGIFIEISTNIFSR